MRLLPSEQNRRAEHAKEEWAKLPEGEVFCLDEPCDCGAHIRHNNGGNPHEEWEFVKDSGKIFARYGNTSEYSQSEWEEISNQQVIQEIENHADWL